MLKTVYNAIKDKNVKIVQGILSWGVDINAPLDDNGETALHLAIYQGLDELSEWLVTKKAAEVNIRNGFGETPLHIAIITKKPNVLKLLLENKAYVDAQDRNYETALHLAVWNSSIECVSLLLKMKADANIKDLDGSTALHITAYIKDQSQLEIAKLLLEHKADPESQNKWKQTPLETAQKEQNTIIIDLLSGGLDNMNEGHSLESKILGNSKLDLSD